jgi:hypothetical protein
VAAARGLTRRALGLGAAAALAGCGSRQAAAPPDFAGMVRALPPVPAGQGRVVVMRDDWVKGEYGEARLVIGGLPQAGVRDGAMVVRDVPPGRYLLAINSSALDHVEFNEFAVEIRPGAAAYIHLVFYVTEGKVLPMSNRTPTNRGGTALSGMPTTIGNFRFSELPGPPR